MNSKFKRLLACLLSLMMVISIFPMSAITAFAAEADEIATVSEGNVAKVGNTEYATIDEAIAAWTNGTTLTLLSNVTLSDVIQLSSTEHHILDLGSYTMTAASKKDAIQIVNNGRSSASYALDIKADSTNPGGITATGKTVVVTTGKSGVKDRPIIRFYNGVFNASYVVKHSGSNGTNCPQFQFHGGEFNGTISTNRALNQFYGGTFTGSLMMSVDSSAYTLIAGGTFKNLSNLYMSALNSGKFTIGSAKGVYDKEVYVDDNGNYVIAAAEPAQGIEAAVAKTPGTNDYLAYSKVATDGVLKYTDATMALEKNNTSSAKVTIYAEDLDLAGIDYKGTIVVPEGKTLKITNAPEGLKVEGNVVVVKPVAKIGETSYNSLSDAIANATAGQTITFIANIAEDITVDKNLTIDGADFDFTGKMTLGEANVVLQNIDFVKGNVVAEKTALTVLNCDFDGQGMATYAMNLGHTKAVVLKDVTGQNYGYGLVQVPSSNESFTATNVTVSDVSIAIKVDYSNAVTLDNVNLTGSQAGFLNSNYGTKTITIKNSDINILGTWSRNTTIQSTYVFEGANSIDDFVIDAAIDNFKLAAGATLTAPNDITVTTDVDSKMVVYTNGAYELDLKHQGGTWGGIDWKLYEDGTLIIAPTKGTPVADAKGRTYEVGEWRERVVYSSKDAAASIGGAPYDMKAVKKLIIEEGVTSIGSFTAQFPNLTGEVVIPSTVTYIGQEAFQKAPMTKLTFAAGGTEELCIAQGAFKNLIIEEVSLPADRPVHLHAWVFNNCHNLKNATLPATLVSVHGTNHIDYFADFNAHSNPTWTQSSEIFAYNENMETITFGSEAVRDMFYAKNNGTSKDYTVANVGLTTYFDLQAAIDAAQDGETVKLIKNVAMTDTVTIPAGKTITLDLNGKTITGTDNATGSFGLITNKGELTITGNGKITLTATNNRGWNAYSSVISNTVGGKLIVENGTIEHLGGTDMAYGIDNLTNGKGTYAETIINGGTIKSTYRAIRMFLNGIEAENILTVNGGVIEGTNKSIWVQDPSTKNNTGKITVAAGAVLNGDVYLYATAGSAEWPVEVSIAASAVNGEVLTGNLPNGYILEKKGGNWTVNEYIAKVGNKYYKTLQAAVDAANQYQTVDLLQDAEGAGVVINKKTTINFAGFTYTLTEPVGSTGTKSNGFQILAGNYTVRLLNGTLKVADDAADKFYILVQNYSDLIVQKMTLDGTNLDKYAFTDGDSYTLSNNSGNVQVNVAKIIANNDGDKAFAFDACDMSASGYKLPSVLVYSSSTIEGKIEAAAKVGQRYYATFEQAFADAEEGKTITLFAPVVVKAGETLNLNKKVTISYTSKVAGEDMITNRGTVIVDGATLVYKNTDKTASNVTVSTISCEPGSVLEVKNGVVKNNSANNGALGIYAYAIDMLTNGNMGDVTANISGGQVICTNYMAIRQFNNGTACKNTLNVTGGYIYGAKRAIQIHMDNNAAYLAISGGKVEAGKDGYALCLFPKAATNVAVTGGEFIGAVYSGTNGIISGGTFDAAVYEGYITESYKMVKVDGVYNVIFDETYGSIATIGDKKYSSFAAAWNDAQNGDTIVLQNNIAIDTETFTVADGKKITLDMNGYTITVTDNATKNYELFYIYGEMVVTGKGTIELTSTNNREWNAMSAIFHNRGGVLTIENGTYTNLGGTDMAWVVDNSGNYYGDAVTNINGGTLTSTYTAIRNRMEQNTHGASGKAILNVTGGKIDGTTSAIWAQAASVSTVAPATGEINISGGEIGLINTARSEGAVSMTTITGGTVAGFKGESGELKVNGGTITGTITILFADGTEPVKTVVKSKVYYGAVAKIGSTYYATLADAIKKCTGAQAITLLRDIEGEGFVITGKTAIDFNGYTYTVTAPVAGTNVGVQINASGKTVRLINGTLTAAEGSGVEVLVENNSTLTIQRQTLAVTSGTALLVKGGSASINIATINAEGATAIEVLAGKITVYSEGRSSFINGEKLAKKSGSNYIPVA